MRKVFVWVSASILVCQGILTWIWPTVGWSFFLTAPIVGLGVFDFYQHAHAIRRNYPILGRLRYVFESIRPEINQYFIESNTDGAPFSREVRSLVYQRAKGMLDTLPFGTQRDVYQTGYEWVNHSLRAHHIQSHDFRTLVGGPDCKQPYSASLFNISAMSYGALSKTAILALNGGAKDGNFAHNTGEGGLSPYHLSPGGDLIWQIGTGYFGCRTPDGQFCERSYAEASQAANIKMIELKLSQGAKPGHGGILPGKKVNAEVAAIRKVPIGKDVLSPPSHGAFSTPLELMYFIKRLRDLSGAKPIGFKLCLGKKREFLTLCKAMIQTGITPDFISVDGGEGGTGAAPLEFSNHVGTPAVEALIFIHNSLIGFGIRDRIKIFSSGKITDGFGTIKRLALGADAVYSARGMMLALGCIQALRCNSNHCPAGVATQDPSLSAGLVPSDKRKRVHSFHRELLKSVAEIIGAMGINSPEELRPWHILRRISETEVKSYAEIFEFIRPGSLMSGGENVPASYKRALQAARADSFESIEEFAPHWTRSSSLKNEEKEEREALNFLARHLARD